MATMNRDKLLKIIYVVEESGEPIWFSNVEECAEPGGTRVVGVYQLKQKVEVSTRQEVVVKKQSRTRAQASVQAAESEPDQAPATLPTLPVIEVAEGTATPVGLLGLQNESRDV